MINPNLHKSAMYLPFNQTGHNADQLLNKMDNLSTLITGIEADFILISEILSKHSVDSLSLAKLSLYGYQAFFNFDPDSY